MAKVNVKLKFEKRIEEIQLDIKKDLDKLARNAAQAAIMTIARNSPVYTGSYADSHRVTIDGAVASGPTIRITRAQSVYAHRQKAISRMRAEAKGFKFGQNLRISNAVPHWRAVEYGEDRTPPYAVYRKAINKVRSYLSKIRKLSDGV